MYIIRSKYTPHISQHSISHSWYSCFPGTTWHMISAGKVSFLVTYTFQISPCQLIYFRDARKVNIAFLPFRGTRSAFCRYNIRVPSPYCHVVQGQQGDHRGRWLPVRIRGWPSRADLAKGHAAHGGQVQGQGHESWWQQWEWGETGRWWVGIVEEIRQR